MPTLAKLWSGRNHGKGTRPTQKCVRLNPDSPEGHYRLARVYRRIGFTALANEQNSLQQQVAKKKATRASGGPNRLADFSYYLITKRSL
jgi:hypothetical protein